MTTPLVFAVPSEADWPSIEALLTASALPADGARAHLSTFLVARRGATIVAVAGTECYGETALLRSVTTAERRGGLGQEIVLRVLDDAHWRGVRTVFLLTTTAATFFPRFGFHVVPRGEMSAAVRQSVEFGAICASATAMRLDLTTRPIVVRRATDADAPSVATCLAWASPAHRPFEGPCTADAVLVWMRTGGAGLTVVVAATVDGPAGAAWFECAGPRPPYDSTAAADLCVAPDMAVHVPVRLGDELARRARASGFVALRAHCVADPLRTTLLRASGFHEAGTHWVRGGADHAAVVARVFERPVGGGTAAGGEASASTLDVLHDELTALLGRRVSRAPSVREIHGRDESPYPPCLPDLVAFPATTDEVSAIVRCAALRGVPVVAFGAGTSLEGHVLPVHGGVTIDLGQMTEVIETNVDDLDVRVQAGVTRTQLEHHLRNTGLAFFVDPGADATLGGMASTRASGTTAVRYGTMRENVLGLTVVLADGRVIRTGGRARKSSAGYDLTRLFVGAEGTLGIITEVTLRLHPRPEAVAVAVCGFPSMHDAVAAASETIQLALPVARIEFLDAAQVAAVNRHAGLAHPEVPMLFFEFHGPSEAAVAEVARAAEAIARDHGSAAFEWVSSPEERARLWKARHEAFFAARAMKPGARVLTTDVCVPISRLAQCVVETRADVDRSGLAATMVGHVGDGNFHVLLLMDPASTTDLHTAKALSRAMVERALAMGGTCSGEHGVGLGKKDYLAIEHGEGVEVMRLIKRALDPQGIMNPGKLLA